ncbi:MAG: 1-acyl-sn-glycerol-3-phosphate acyltransferase [Chloroflexi bacterium]|nr:1-acyl-sn-glycerol-3-phosphate acyltransferase [Chloroflexota bacterium]
MILYKLCNVLTRLVLLVFSRCEVSGLENVPRDGTLIVVANHIGWLDPSMLGALLGRDIRFMAKDELFRMPFVSWVVKGYGAFPVRRGERDRQALRVALEILKSGGVLGMFPEGTRSKNARLRAGHPGAAILALQAHAPILPVGIAGTQNVLRFPNIFKRPYCKMNVGRAFTLSADSGKDRLADAVDEMMLRVADLLPEEYRGVYGRERNASEVS